jgi:exopolyphosphatase/guanosine-5'-triphosphate,3'-diphosphate pyrophosphatase
MYGCTWVRPRQVLSWAAHLHELGLMVAHTGYHKHSAYILGNADMPGFSRTEQARLALLARAQRGALLKLPAFASGAVSDNDRLMVWLLRQAVILCRSRSEPRLPAVRAETNGKRFRLTLPEGWLQRRPLTQRALEEEAVHWSAVGVKYSFA